MHGLRPFPHVLAAAVSTGGQWVLSVVILPRCTETQMT
jgi:hypothetical protein